VISENATEQELAQYGLLAPETLTEPASTEEAAKRGARLKLSDANQEVVGDLVVGKVIAQQGQSAATAYVRPFNDQGIYRVTLNKELLTTNLADWVNPNPLGLQAPAGVPTLGPATRVVERIEVSTAPAGRPESDPYRAEFRMSEPIVLLKLETFSDGQWAPIPAQRLPASNEFTQTWRVGLQVVPAFFLLSDVQVKSEGLQQELRKGEIRAGMDVSELEDLGLRLETVQDAVTLTGQSGTMVVHAQGGLRFHFALGKINSGDLIPTIVYATLDPAAIRPRPEMGTLPAEAAEWPADRRTQETETLQREHARRVEDWTAANRQLTQELTLLNDRLATWIYYLPARYALQAIPNIRLGTATETPPQLPAETAPPGDSAIEATRPRDDG
jgi:hypothetical protein